MIENQAQVNIRVLEITQESLQQALKLKEPWIKGVGGGGG